MLEARGIVQRVAGKVLLGPIDVRVTSGEFVAVVGPNGAGKTTLLRLLTGVAQPVAGEVRLDGGPLGQLSGRDRAQRIAYVPQVRPQSVPLTVRQLVTLGRYPNLTRWQRTPSADDWRAIDAALDRVGLVAFADRALNSLSGGERQAAYIAAALAPGAEILVLDEPATHLDPKHQVDLARLLEGLHREGRTIVAATHDLGFAGVLADRIVVLREGDIAAEGPTDELMRPERLAELFDAPFEVASIGGRPVPRLALETGFEAASDLSDRKPTR